jgi:hypothetical protein
MEFSSKEDILVHVQAETRYIMMRIVADGDDLPELHSQMLAAQDVRKEYLFRFEFIQLTVRRHCVVSSQNTSIYNLPPLSLGLSWEDWIFEESTQRFARYSPAPDFY